VSRIRILPENLANQIAAGEVVERPASVVKELLENAADAGADQITVQVDGAGTSLRVIDNGCGMDGDDLLLALERHATSKLADAGDLFRVRTMGFRGEALPSIASVSRMKMVSRQAGEPLGNQVEIAFGRIVGVGEAGCPFGTTVEIADLFGNVPARRKFLRTRRTEIAHIDEVVRNFALAWPQIALAYQKNGRESLRLPPTDLLARYRKISGVSELTPFSLSDDVDSGEILVRGGLLPPEECDASARLCLLVNRRPVRDRFFFRAVAEGMRGFIPAGGRPGGIVSLDLPPGEVDVNVHPAKLEVRFRSPGTIMTLVTRAVASAIAAMQEDLRPVFTAASSPGDRPAPSRTADSFLRREPCPGGLFQKKSLPAQGRSECDRIIDKPYHSAPTETGEIAERTVSDPAPSTFEVVGQAFDTYILVESGDELLVIDQHAAQERLRFETLKAQYLGGSVSSQRLIFPEKVELSPAEVEAVEGSGELIARLGLLIEPFGGSTYLVKAVPALLGTTAAASVVREVLARLPGASGAGEKIDDILASMACRSSIMAGRRLSGEEMTALVREMAGAGIFSHCPHGRPVIRRLNRREVEGWFRRG